MSKHREWLVLLLVGLALFLGAITKQKATHQLQTVTWEGNRFDVPAHWTITNQEHDIFVATDLEQGPFGPRVMIRRISSLELSPVGAGLWNMANNWALKQTKQFSDHRVLGITQAAARGRVGMKMECVYLQDVGPNLTPALMQSSEVLVNVDKDVYVWIFAAQESEFSNYQKLQIHLLENWRPQ